MTNPPKFCATCGAPVIPGDRFCANCGSPVAAGASPVSPQAQWPTPALAPDLATPSYAPSPQFTKGRSKAPCAIGGCLIAAVLLAVGCWALY